MNKRLTFAKEKPLPRLKADVVRATDITTAARAAPVPLRELINAHPYT